MNELTPETLFRTIGRQTVELDIYKERLAALQARERELQEQVANLSQQLSEAQADGPVEDTDGES